MSVRMENVAAPRKLNYKMMEWRRKVHYIRLSLQTLLDALASVFSRLTLRIQNDN
ncbi:hypothetical protein WN51_04150 [Melipona quadrifasciata]|uniref:Uncharacterized protein n=1 Tax=Melipona quadrifasciata TaxID=166423 RepID=A0A0N0BCH9_9HYME|nr:hypothetical protein WN51_04150 [Melipona quadrifasciata]